LYHSGKLAPPSINLEVVSTGIDSEKPEGGQNKRPNPGVFFVVVVVVVVVVVAVVDVVVDVYVGKVPKFF